MSTGPTDPQPAPEPAPPNPAELYQKALADDDAVAADQAKLHDDQQTDTMDHQVLSNLVVQYPTGVVVVTDQAAGKAMYLTSDGGPKVTTTPVKVFFPPTPAPTGGP